MSFDVIPTPYFIKLFKKLSRRYPSLKDDLKHLVTLLQENPDHGIALGHGLFKIRMAISSKGKGRSGGARVITFWVSEEKEVYLVHIYDKSRLENLTKDQIMTLLKNAGLI